ncbi:MAG: hypothetical protein LBT92_03690, partial [Rickettsiales bacterium]|nr:hypothetical protein [Rickettsiales bacterium]
VEDALRKSKAAAVEDLYRENLRAGREDFKQSFSPPVDGVHRSDFSARDAAKGIDAALMSTGEQKLAVASIVLAYVRMIYLYFGSYPVILFDEAPAHLDRGRLLELERRLAAIPTQVWFTGTDAADFEFFKGGDARFIEL